MRVVIKDGPAEGRVIDLPYESVSFIHVDANNNRTLYFIRRQKVNGKTVNVGTIGEIVIG